MFRSILVPTDLTIRAKPAIDLAITMAKTFGSRVTLLHVIETIEGASFEDFKDFYKRLEARANKELDKLVSESSSEIEISKVVVFGKRAVEIVRYAEQEGMDLIIISSHKVDLLKKEPSFGTISYKVGIMAPCPVLLVK